MTAGWCSRTLRAAVFAVVCVLLAALGHVMMSGSQVPPWALAAGAAVTGAAGWCLAGRERGLPLITAVVVAAQTLLHSAFSRAQSASWAPGSTGHDMPSMDMGHATGGTSASGMLAAHLLAALLCGLWLAHGERAAFRILRAVAGWLAAPLRLLLAPSVIRDRPRVRPRPCGPDRVPRLLLVHAITSRGPPPRTAVL